MTEELQGLLACPFCGCTTPIVGTTLDDGCYVFCGRDECFGGYAYAETEAQAIIGWNRRASLTEKDAEIAEAVERFTTLAKAVKAILPIGDASKSDSAVFPVYVTMGELRALRDLAARALHQNPESKA